MQKKIAVFGSSVIKKDSKQFRVAYETGLRLVQAGFTVVNGGYGGSMLATAQGAKEAGGHTLGVTTDDFGSGANRFIDREIRSKTWQERLHQLIQLGDGYLILDGGTGTLTELMVVWEMAAKGFHRKPIVILGRYLRLAIRAFRRNPEVKIPKEFYFASTPKAAVQHLVSYLHHV